MRSEFTPIPMRQRRNFQAGSWLEIESHFKPWFDEAGVQSMESLLDRFAVPFLNQRRAVWVQRKELNHPDRGPLSLYVKQYSYPASQMWKFLGRSSKAACEWSSYRTFRQLGIRSASPVALAEKRLALGLLNRAVIVTQTIPDAVPLDHFVRDHCCARHSPSSRSLRDRLTRQVSEMVRRIHQANFFHNDLRWRNILVNRPNHGDPLVWWIDCPRGTYQRRRWIAGRKRLKDLALLDKDASAWCAQGERIRFLKYYLQEECSSSNLKQLIDDMQAYRRKRWRG